MISKDDINKLSELSRLAVKEEEKDKLLSDLEGILGYVAELERYQQTLT
jgi:aspartyl/glutamyl-tRNA(Asn/Gln) amidotransferase C subunit